MDDVLTLRLRRETQAAHQRLEDSLALLDGAPDRERFTQALRAFLGFHAAWEPAVAASPGTAGAFEGRSRLPHLRRDLLALGEAPETLARLPRCDAAAGLADAPASALGSLYVMEGSTLGGQVLARAVAGAGWGPAGGLTYFNPYGMETGRRWRALQAELNAAPRGEHDAVVAGAQATFALLRDWMRAAGPPPPR